MQRNFVKSAAIFGSARLDGEERQTLPSECAHALKKRCPSLMEVMNLLQEMFVLYLMTLSGTAIVRA